MLRGFPAARVVREKLSELLRYAALAGCVYVLASQWAHHSSGPKEGSRAAGFDLPLVGEAGRISLASQKGKSVVMEVFASWCSVCKRSSPGLVEAWRAHRHDNVTFLAVSVDEDTAAARRTKADWNIPFDVAIDDGSVAKGYRISLLPTLIYIDERGMVRHASAGATSRSDLEAWIAER